MRPLPRLHAVTDATVIDLADFPVRAAAIAAAGSAVAIHVRDREAGGARLAGVAHRVQALARPAEAAVFVNGRPDLAAAVQSHGLQLGQEDLGPAEARSAFGALWKGWIGVSVHSLMEAERAVEAGADYLIVGSIYPSATHPGRPVAGPALLRQAATTGLPVIAIGGITDDRLEEVRDAGAYGVAAIGALWRAPDPAAAAVALLAPWSDAA